MGFKEIFSAQKKKPPSKEDLASASASAAAAATTATTTSAKQKKKKNRKTKQNEEEDKEEEEEEEKRTTRTTRTGGRGKKAQPSLPTLDVRDDITSRRGGKTARSPTAAKLAEMKSSLHAKKLKKTNEEEEEMETEKKEEEEEEEEEEEVLLTKLSRNMRELKRALDAADTVEDQTELFGRLRDVEIALKAIEVSEDVLAASTTEKERLNSLDDEEWSRKKCTYFSKCMIRCWNVAVVSDAKTTNVGAAVVSINVREKVLELLTEAKSACDVNGTIIDGDLLISLSGKLAETCYECARFSMAEKYFKKALEGTRFDCDFSEDESPSKEELRDHEEDEEIFFCNFKVASLRGANFIRLNDLSKASSMFAKCARTLLFANAMSSSSESAKKARMVSIFFGALEKLAKDLEDLDISSNEDGDGEPTKRKMMDVIKVALENLIEVAETIDTSVFPLATKKNMQTRAAKVCVFLNEDASKHLNLVEDDDKKKSKDTISTIEDAQTLLLSAQTSLLNDGKVDYAEKCALRVLGEDGDAKDERFEKTRTLRTFASAAFVLALATKNVNAGIERIEKRLKAIQAVKDDECKFALIASTFWAAFSITSSASSTSLTNEENEYTAIKYAERLLTPSSLITQILTSSDSKESSPLLARARALAWNYAVDLELIAEAAYRGENAKKLAKLAHDAFDNVVAIDKLCREAGFISENKESIECQSFQNDEADALKTRAFCALSASSPSDDSSLALASHAVQALEAHESREMRLVSASTALLRLKLCRAELQNLRCKEKDATLQEEENTITQGKSAPGSNNKTMIVSRVKTAFHTVCRVGDPNAIIFAASELDALADAEIIADALRSAWDALITFCEKKKLNAPQQQQQKTTIEKQDEDNIKSLKNEAMVFRAYLAHAWRSLSTTGTMTTIDPSKFFVTLVSDVTRWLARTAKIPMLLKIFPESLVIIDIVFDLVDLCLQRASKEKSTSSSLSSSSSSLIDCVRRLSFAAAQLLERVQSSQEYDKEASPASKFRASCMSLTCFQIAIAAMLDGMREDDEKALSKTEKAVAKFQECIEKAKEEYSSDVGQMETIRKYEDNLIAYEYAVLNLQNKRKGATSLSAEEVKAFCNGPGSKVSSPRVLLRLCEDYPDNKAAGSVINNIIVERILESANKREAFDGITLAAAFRRLFAAEEQNEKALQLFSLLSTLKPPQSGTNTLVLPTAEAEYLVSLAFNRATHMERLEEPEKALTWVKSIEKVIEKKKDTEEEDETTFLSRSLRPTFVEILAERLRDAEADLQGEIGVRV
ncbi:unnamed protein product [Bathycoccus prasinos]